MCGRYEQSTEIQEIVRQVQETIDVLKLKSDIYPTNLAPVITQECPTAMV